MWVILGRRCVYIVKVKKRQRHHFGWIVFFSHKYTTNRFSWMNLPIPYIILSSLSLSFSILITLSLPFIREYCDLLWMNELNEQTEESIPYETRYIFAHIRVFCCKRMREIVKKSVERKFSDIMQRLYPYIISKLMSLKIPNHRIVQMCIYMCMIKTYSNKWELSWSNHNNNINEMCNVYLRVHGVMGSRVYTYT